ncbi:MAG: PD-(D/E)XK nuclease family protein [Bacteroidota bacterium]
MQIVFGLQLDEEVFPRPAHTTAEHSLMGPHKLLDFLAIHCGLGGKMDNNQHLRIEFFRQLLGRHLEQQADAFYQDSFAADQLATAATLLQARDELLLAGWNFSADSQAPERLQTLANLEASYLPSLASSLDQLPHGFADRFRQMEQVIGQRKLPLTQLQLVEPIHLYPICWQRIFPKLQQKGVVLTEAKATTSPSGNSDLSTFRRLLLQADQEEKLSLQGDGSLLILKAKRETDAAAYLAALLRHNPQFRPLCLIPEKNRALDNALIQEGLPSLGIQSASLARPSLQILKLATTFFWHPIDPFKILEFVSLPVKPLDDRLANAIASQMARRPGLRGEGWYAAINRLFEKLAEEGPSDKKRDLDEVRYQYQFWFERKRYKIGQKVPSEDVREVFHYLAEWATTQYDLSGNKNHSLLVLKEQARRICDLLEALPNAQPQLTYLELERIVRTIYEPSPVVFQERELGHYPYVHSPGAITQSTPQLLWWNFTRNERDYFFSRWYKNEIQWLQERGVQLQGPKEDNARLLWHRSQPILQCENQLLLVMPESIDGQEVFAHPLHDELEAAFGELTAITIEAKQSDQSQLPDSVFRLPHYQSLDPYQLGSPRPFLHIQRKGALEAREEETFTSLDSLFYYPYQWAFRHKVQLKKSSILSVVNDVTLMGNLSHRMLEVIFQEDIREWQKKEVDDWVDQHAGGLLAREGAVLLMYGREPERIAFLNRIKYAAWSLISMIQQNGWSVEATEMDLKGPFQNIPVKAKADLVLRRGDEWAVIDLKWRGTTRRQNIIRNEEDIQLTLYARLLTEGADWAHTAYFILDKGVMIARNHLAFKEAMAVSPDLEHQEVNQRIWQRMANTFDWRMKQLTEGQLEVRTRQTADEIDETYGADLLDLLEMRSEDAPFDDYRTLINLIE